MTTRKIHAALCLAVFFALAAVAQAADSPKVGVVDLQRCLNETRLGKKYKADFSAEAEQMKSSLEQEETALKNLREELEKQGVVLSETAREEKERTYKEQLDAFKEKFKASQQALQRKDQELTRKILKDLQGVIRELGETQGYTVILERGEGGILYAAATVDVTDEVIRRFDQAAGQ